MTAIGAMTFDLSPRLASHLPWNGEGNSDGEAQVKQDETLKAQSDKVASLIKSKTIKPSIHNSNMHIYRAQC